MRPTEASTVMTHLEANSLGSPVPSLPSSLSFMPDVLPAGSLPIYPRLGQAPSYAGLHNPRLGCMYVWKMEITVITLQAAQNSPT